MAITVTSTDEEEKECPDCDSTDCSECAECNQQECNCTCCENCGSTDNDVCSTCDERECCKCECCARCDNLSDECTCCSECNSTDNESCVACSERICCQCKCPSECPFSYGDMLECTVSVGVFKAGQTYRVNNKGEDEGLVDPITKSDKQIWIREEDDMGRGEWVDWGEALEQFKLKNSAQHNEQNIDQSLKDSADKMKQWLENG